MSENLNFLTKAPAASTDASLLRAGPQLPDAREARNGHVASGQQTDVLVRQGWIVGEKRHLPGRHS